MKRFLRNVLVGAVSAAALFMVPVMAHAGSESGVTPTCVSGARPTVRGEQTRLDTMRVDMPNGTIRYNAATAYSYVYQHPTLTRASWYVSSVSLKDSGTYGVCAPV